MSTSQQRYEAFVDGTLLRMAWVLDTSESQTVDPSQPGSPSHEQVGPDLS